MTETIQMSGVHKSFGRTPAVTGADLCVEPGVTALLGPNGAGKTTLMRMAATVMAPDSGSIRLLGMDPTVGEQRHAIRRRLGYVPQEPGFHPGFTVFEFIDYVAILKELTNRRVRHDEVRRVIDAVGLTAVMHKRIRKLSGGMRRRVILAQALLDHPSLLVLDEPTVGLDPEQRLRFRELLSRLADDVTVLLSTHQTEDVAALSQRVAVMTEGRVVFDGPPRDLVAMARGRVWLSAAPDPGARLSWRAGDGRFRHIGEAAPADAELVEPTIEDGYLLLVGEQALREEAA